MLAQVFVIMLTFMGTQHLVPASEFRLANPIFDLNCPPFHLHALNGVNVRALDGVVIPDPDPSVCGYGLVGLIPFGVYPPSALADADGDGIPDVSDSTVNDPDADDNGVIDGLEDPDDDGINTATELNLAFSDPGLMDSDGNGIDDRVQYWNERSAGEFTHVFITSGAYTFANISIEAMSGNVDLANELLKGSRFHLVPNDPKIDVIAGDDGDGALTASEREASRHYFGWDLDAAGRRGFYAGYSFDVGSDIGSPDVTLHGMTPFSFMVPNNDPLLNAAYLASSFGLAVGILLNATGAEDDLSTPFDLGLESYINSNGLSGVGYSDEATASVFELGLKYQLGGTTFVTGTTVTQRRDQWGRMNDDQGDASPGDMDIDAVSIQGEEGLPVKRVRFELLRDFPMTAFTSYLSLAWDIDDDTATGETIAGVSGIDLENIVEVHRAVDNGPLTTSHMQLDNTTFTRALGLPPKYSLNLYRSPFSTQPPTATPAAVVEFDIDFSNIIVPIDVSTIPIYAFTRDFDDLDNDTVTDQMDFEFRHRDFEVRPSLTYGSGLGGGTLLAAPSVATVAALPDETVDLVLARLTPLTGFELFVDNASVLSDTTDASGDYVGTFVVPSGLASGEYFLTALDQTGEYAGSVLVVPEAGAFELGVVAMGAVLALGWRRRRLAS